MPPKKSESGAAPKKSTAAGHSYQVCYTLPPQLNDYCDTSLHSSAALTDVVCL